MAYADDVGMISRNIRTLTEAYNQLEEGAQDLGLLVNEKKTKYMVSSKLRKGRPDPLKIGEKLFERVTDFRYLGSTITEKNDTSYEIKARIAAGNKSYFSSLQMLRSSLLNKESKIKIYKAIIKPVVTYGAETWSLTNNDERLLLIWERKILRKIFGPINDNGAWRIRTNKELQNMYKAPDIIADIKSKRIRWIGHVQRMDSTRACFKIFNGKPEGKRTSGRPKKRYLDGIEEDLKQLEVRGWRRKAADRDEWRTVVEKAKALKGCCAME